MQRTMNPPKLPPSPPWEWASDGAWMLSWCTLWLRYWAIRSAAATGEPYDTINHGRSVGLIRRQQCCFY